MVMEYKMYVLSGGLKKTNGKSNLTESLLIVNPPNFFWQAWGFRVVFIIVRGFGVVRFHREEVSCIVIRDAWNSSVVVREKSFVVLKSFVKLINIQRTLRCNVAGWIEGLADDV